MTTKWVKWLMVILAIASIVFGVLIFNGDTPQISLFMVLCGVLLIVMAQRIAHEKLELHETFVSFGTKKIAYNNIHSITKSRQPLFNLGYLSLNLLAGSIIYKIESEQTRIEIIGRFYADVEDKIQAIAAKSQIRITER